MVALENHPPALYHSLYVRQNLVIVGIIFFLRAFLIALYLTLLVCFRLVRFSKKTSWMWQKYVLYYFISIMVSELSILVNEDPWGRP